MDPAKVPDHWYTPHQAATKKRTMKPGDSIFAIVCHIYPIINGYRQSVDRMVLSSRCGCSRCCRHSCGQSRNRGRGPANYAAYRMLFMILCVSLSLNSYSIWEVGVVDIVLETASRVFVTVTSKCTFDRIFGQLTNLPMPGRHGIGGEKGGQY